MCGKVRARVSTLADGWEVGATLMPLVETIEGIVFARRGASMRRHDRAVLAKGKTRTAALDFTCATTAIRGPEPPAAASSIRRSGGEHPGNIGPALPALMQAMGGGPYAGFNRLYEGNRKAWAGAWRQTCWANGRVSL